MKRIFVTCGLCGSIVKLTKSGAVPDHPVGDLRVYRRCNGVRHGLRIAMAAQASPRQAGWRQEARLRALRYHRAGKSTANDPGQRQTWLWRQGLLPRARAACDVSQPV